MPKKAGIAIMAAGAVLIISALLLFVHNRQEDAQAGQEAESLLESVEAGERFGRYSFIGLNPRGVFSVEEGRAYYADADGKRELDAPEGPFMALRGLLKGIRPAVVPESWPSGTTTG